jgi:hypothetical protein
MQQLNADKEHASQETYDNQHPFQDFFQSETHCISEEPRTSKGNDI